jgi:hypothetical protein
VLILFISFKTFFKNICVFSSLAFHLILAKKVDLTGGQGGSSNKLIFKSGYFINNFDLKSSLSFIVKSSDFNLFFQYNSLYFSGVYKLILVEI